MWKNGSKQILFLQSFGLRKDARLLGTAFLLRGIRPSKQASIILFGGVTASFGMRSSRYRIGRRRIFEFLKQRYRYELGVEEATALAIQTAVRKAQDTESLLIVTIERKTKRFKELTPEEKRRLIEKSSVHNTKASQLFILSYFC